MTDSNVSADLLQTIWAHTVLGDRIALSAVEAADSAIEIARSGRDVWAFEANDASIAARASQSAEIASRLKLVTETLLAFSGRAPNNQFEVIVLGDAWLKTSRPLAWLRSVLPLVRPGGLVIIETTRSAIADTGRRWRMGDTILRDVLSQFGEVCVRATADGRRDHVVLTPGPVIREDRLRVGVVLRVTAEDRWIRQCLAALPPCTSYIVAVIENASDGARKIVGSDRRTIRLQIASEVTTLDLDARAWEPDWLIYLNASDVIREGSVERLEQALRTSGPDIACIQFLTLYLWNDDRTIRSDVPVEAQRRVVARRGTDIGGVRKTIEHDAEILCFEWLDRSVRNVRRISNAAEAALQVTPAYPDSFIQDVAAAQPLDEWSDPSVVGKLLRRTLLDTTHRALRALCIDPSEHDFVRLIREHSPQATVSSVSRDGRSAHPRFEQYNFSVTAEIESLDIPLVFGPRRFDLIVDADGFRSAERGTSRLHAIVTCLDLDGTLLTVVDEATSHLQLADILERRSFSIVGLHVVAVHASLTHDGGRVSIVQLVKHKQIAVTYPGIVVVIEGAQVHANLPSDIPILTVVRPLNTSTLIDVSHNMDVLNVYEPGTESIIAAAFERYPAEVICLLRSGPPPPAHWYQLLTEHFAQDDVGIVTLGESVFAIRSAAIHPHVWPIRFCDPRLQVEAVASIAGRRGYRTIRFEPSGKGVAPYQPSAELARLQRIGRITI